MIIVRVCTRYIARSVTHDLIYVRVFTHDLIFVRVDTHDLIFVRVLHTISNVVLLHTM